MKIAVKWIELVNIIRNEVTQTKSSKYGMAYTDLLVDISYKV